MVAALRLTIQYIQLLHLRTILAVSTPMEHRWSSSEASNTSDEEFMIFLVFHHGVGSMNSGFEW